MVAWGAAYVLTGASLVLHNVAAIVTPRSWLVADLLLLAIELGRIAAVLLLARFAWARLPRRSRIGSALLLLGGSALALAWAGSMASPPTPSSGRAQALDFARMLVPALPAVPAGFLWVTLIEALRTRTMAQARTWLLAAFPLVGGLAAPALAIGLDHMFPDLVVHARDLPPVVVLDVLMVVVHAAPIAWCFALLGGPHGRMVRNLLLALFAWVAASLAYSRTAPDFGGFFGVLPAPLRVLALVALGIAILAGDFLPTPLRRPTARRGALAGAALASLIIAAQIAQNFLGSTYGTYVGGAVAGAVLVAAAPLQRRLEQAAVLRQAGSRGAEASFRRAARLALRDHGLARQEEVDLLDLAFRLGIPPGRAATLIDLERVPGAAPEPP